MLSSHIFDKKCILASTKEIRYLSCKRVWSWPSYSTQCNSVALTALNKQEKT